MKNVQKELFSFWVSKFLTDEIIVNRNLSFNTQKSYRDAFLIFIRFIEDKYKLNPVKFRIMDFNIDMVLNFLQYIGDEIHSSPSTCNQRLAAIKSFTKYVLRAYPDFLANGSAILYLQSKKTLAPVVDYLTKEEMEKIISLPDKSTKLGFRDYLLLLLMYNTGARVSEVCNIRIESFVLGEHSYVTLNGKGKKQRITPLWKKTSIVIEEYIKVNNLSKNDYLFYGVRRNALTRFGIYEIMEKYIKTACLIVPELQAKKLSPHSIRHTTAVQLLLAGVDINTIRAWLGHSHIETTNIYATITLEIKRKAIDLCSTTNDKSIPLWKSDNNLATFLKKL